jgi:tRNA pseudouridine38-40 synthase
MTRRVRMIIQYDGTAYAGWQRQLTGLGIQQVMEEELTKLTGHKCALHASGRTDSGVHAAAQVAHFDTDCRIPAEKFAFALNTGLPKDIRVVYSDEAEPRFHARFDVVRKHYRYRVLNTPHDCPFTRNTALHYHWRLDKDKLNEAAAMFMGQHDFNAFMAVGVTPETTVRTIYESRWSEENGLLVYDVAGSGFLYNMVRIMVGTMLQYGQGRNIDGIARALETGRRDFAGPTAPAHGLTLARVEYENFDTKEHVR